MHIIIAKFNFISATVSLLYMHSAVRKSVIFNVVEHYKIQVKLFKSTY